MLLISRNSGARELAEPSLATDAKVYRTSSAVTSPRPPWNWTPLRRWNFQVRPPSATVQRSASMGLSSPVLGSRVRRFSYMGLRTTSSAPTYRWGNQRSLPNVATATVSVSGREACPVATAAAPGRAATINARSATRSLMVSPPGTSTCA